MTEDRNLPPPLPPRLDWFVHTQMGQLAQDGVPEWFHGAISREAAEDLLRPKPPGSFLIRVSHSHVGYALSYKAQDCCRHFMVKLLDDGNVLIPGETTAHTSLEALVTFYQQEPMRPYEELLTQPCGQEDPGNMDYEDLFLYSNALAEEAANPTQDPRGLASCPEAEKTSPKSAALSRPKERKPSTEMDRTSSCPPKVPLGDAGQKLWKNLKSLPKKGKKVQQQLRSHLATVSLPLLWDNKCDSAAHSSRAVASGQKNAGAANCVYTDSIEGAQAPHWFPRGRNAFSREALRSVSWSGVSLGDRSQHQEVVRSTSLQVSTQGLGDVPEPQEDWIPEEYLRPPPFAPGYC
ncbi:PREDICTED: hematopoietic SH2 domain-containing protein [Elephantulus edwardii]|uniref:hematopoietic SH2 domain-containing protein n=1 Tax=Elephantulus edwardii TaxID=28737 RepID=UPI0003F0633F|nr:PREDICTED: hematopoietic SH2 domain-containing protein [Elephantulus edwardii]